MYRAVIYRLIFLERNTMIEYTKVLECYILYVEYGMSYREVAKELCLKSHNTVKKRLEQLAYINDEMYQTYKNKVKERSMK